MYCLVGRTFPLLLDTVGAALAGTAAVRREAATPRDCQDMSMVRKTIRVPYSRKSIKATNVLLVFYFFELPTLNGQQRPNNFFGIASVHERASSFCLMEEMQTSV